MERRVPLQGKNITEKLAHLERILGSYQNRLARTVIGVIPPVPFMSYVSEPELGVIANMLIPISGIIDMAFIRIGNYDVRPAAITVSIQSGTFNKSVEFECSRSAHSFEAGWDIKAGDLLVVYGEGIHDIHIAFAVQPALNRAVKEKHMLEGFLALMEEQDNGHSI